MRSASLYGAFEAMCEDFHYDEVCGMLGPKKAIGTTDVLAMLAPVKARKAVVLSSAYFFGSPYVSSMHYDVSKMTRLENEYVANQVAEAPQRLVGFFSVDPLQPSAVDEVNFWIHDGRLKGLKLHLANSRVRLTNPQHVQQLVKVIHAAASAHLPIVIHLRASDIFGAREAGIFIRDVLPSAGDSVVQIAHCGGWGGTDQAQAVVLQVFADHIKADDPSTRHVLFDLSAVVTPETTPEQAARLVAQMRQIGLHRFLLGSDFNASTPAYTDSITRAKLPLTNAEWRLIAGNIEPWVR
ncbi:amidohydrolase family protein [Dyella flagellata]|nr:amidohydrolase family protein [Dyella flagellata]